MISKFVCDLMFVSYFKPLQQVHIVFEIVDALKNEEGFEKKIVSQLCDKRCPDWPWDLAWQLLELALQCTHKFPQRRPEMKEVCNLMCVFKALCYKFDSWGVTKEPFH